VLEIDLARSAFESALQAQRLAGPPLRVALVLAELAQLLPDADPARAEACAAEAAALAAAAGHPVLIAMTADLRARLACRGGDFDAAHELLGAALPAVVGQAGESSLRLLHADVCIDRQDWVTLEQQGRAIVALGQVRRDPMLLTLGQRHLGLALVETGHHAEAAELLEAAMARARIDEPLLVGPVGWALGNALSGAGEPGAARTAYASSATAFEAAARPDEAAHAQARAGDCAWDIGDTLAAGAHYEAAGQHARVAGSVDVYAVALRSLAALRAGGGELAAGLDDLDAVPTLTRDFAAEHGHEDADEWPERLGFGIARQGARLLLGAGEPLAAATRLAALEPTLVGEAAAVVRAERGSYLAAGGNLAGAEPLLVEALPLLDAEHLVGFRVDCAGRWAQALHDAGEVERADEVWQRFGG
jgi:tetratricopeptide (TPR) repeat protein